MHKSFSLSNSLAVILASPLRSRFLSAAHRGRDTLNRRQSNMQLVVALQNLSIVRRAERTNERMYGRTDARKNDIFAVGEISRGTIPCRRRRAVTDVSNLIYRGRAPSTRYEEEDAEVSRGRARRLESQAEARLRLACIALKRCPKHVQTVILSG